MIVAGIFQGRRYRPQGPMIDQGSAARLGALDPCGAEFVEKLAAFLSARGVLDDLAMHRAQRAQRQSGERFDLVLTRLGLVSEASLAGLLAEFLGLPLVDAEPAARGAAAGRPAAAAVPA